MWQKIWRCGGSNPGPFTCKANALPLSYIPYVGNECTICRNIEEDLFGTRIYQPAKNICTHGGTRTPNLRFRRPTPYPLGHAGTPAQNSCNTPRQLTFPADGGKNNIFVRRPGIEPGSQEWESCMIPLHQRRTIGQIIRMERRVSTKRLSTNHRRDPTLLTNKRAAPQLPSRKH